MNQFISHAKSCALIVSIIVFAAGGERAANSVFAQHSGHDTPGVKRSEPKSAAPQKRVAPQKKTESETKPAADDQHDRHDMHRPSPAAKPSPQPEAEPTPVKEKDGESPAAPAPTAPRSDARPAATEPLPAAIAPVHSAPHKHDAGDTNRGSEDDKAPPSDTNDGTHGTHASGMASMNSGDADSVMFMSNDMMNIRVGSSTSNFIPMSQMGSGTSWQPTTTPMYMWHERAGDWMLMFHGEAKLGVNAQGGPRGDTKFESQNWFMPMAFRRVGPGTLALRGMFSLEPFTFPKRGSGQLFQTGETFEGRPLVDAQHPHDLFMELSASYTVPIGERATWFTYLGFPGEPALGPVAFMHRWSASENPAAPLSHHLQDSTHISFGVFTTGITYRWFKLEGSLFNGREPDEERYDFEFNPWNSRSARLSFAPNENWSAQVSYGLLKNPEALEPGDIRRMTASLTYNKPWDRGNWATSFVWGRNREFHHEEPATLNGYLLESTLNFLDRNYLYTRLELVDKNNLLSHDEAEEIGIEAEEPLFRIGAYTFGAAREVWNTEKFSVAVGGDFTFYSKPDVLDQVYGRNPTSYKMFVRIRPGKMNAGGHGGH